MTVLLPNSAFLHIPKTGGTWVRNALKASDLHVAELRSSTKNESSENNTLSWHNVPIHNEEYCNRENVFCFVRNPFTWYQSYWAYKIFNDNWRKHNAIDRCRDEKFDVFIDNVLEEFPDGYVTWLYDFYAHHATFVGLTERLPTDLIEVLAKFGEDFVMDALVNTPRARVSAKSLKEKAVYRRTQIEKLFIVEEQVIKKYGYTNAVSFLRFS